MGHGVFPASAGTPLRTVAERDFFSAQKIFLPFAERVNQPGTARRTNPVNGRAGKRHTRRQIEAEFAALILP